MYSFCVFSQNELIDYVETSPVFPGGEDSLWCFIESQFDFRILNIHEKQGQIMASFVIDEKGKVTNIETNPENLQRFDWFMKDSLIEDEIKRVLNLLPAWTPAVIETRPVKTKCSLPIKIPYTELKCKNFDNPTFAYWKVEQPAVFQFDGEVETKQSIQKYIDKNGLWPSEDECTGRVIVRAIVDERGKLSDFTIVRGLDGCRGFNEEALRLVKQMPGWTPAKVNGKPVRSYCMIPIPFRLR